MKLALWLVLVGCAGTTTTQVRSIDGRPLPTYAALDADASPQAVRCNGQRYLVVEDSPPFVLGTRVGTTRVVITDPSALCAAIRAN